MRLRLFRLKSLVLLAVTVLSASGCSTPRVAMTPWECVRLNAHGRSIGLMLDEPALSPSGAYLAIATSRGPAVYRTATLELLWYCPTAHWVHDLAWSPDERILATTDLSRCVFLWDAQNGEYIESLCGHPHDQTTIEWSCNPNRLASSSATLESRRGQCVVWDTDSQARLITLHSDGMKWSPDGTTLATWSYHKNTIALRDAKSGRVMGELAMPDDVYDVAWSPDGAKLASTAKGGHTVVWDIGTGFQASTTLASGTIAWSPTSQVLAIGGAIVPDSLRPYEETEEVLLCDTRAEQLHTLPGHEFAFSPDGRRIVTALSDGFLIVWDAASGRELARLQGHEMWVHTLGWSADGGTIVAASRERVSIWDAGTDQLVTSTSRIEIGIRGKPRPPRMAHAESLLAAESWTEAIEALEGIVSEEPENAMAWFQLGRVLSATNQPDDAVTAYQKAARNPSFRSLATYNVACIHAVAGELDLAVSTLNEARGSGFINFELLKYDPDMKQLRENNLIDFPPERQYQQLRIPGSTLKFTVILPENYEPSRRYPTLVTFPPGRWREASADWALSTLWKDSARLGWIVVCPVLSSSGLTRRLDLDDLILLLRYIKYRYAIADRYHLVAFERGCFPAVEVAFSSPQLFQSLTTASSWIWDSYEYPGLRRLKDMSVHILVGEDDLEGIRSSEDILREMQSQGVNAQRSLVPGDGYFLHSLLDGGLMQYMERTFGR